MGSEWLSHGRHMVGAWSLTERGPVAPVGCVVLARVDELRAVLVEHVLDYADRLAAHVVRCVCEECQDQDEHAVAVGGIQWGRLTILGSYSLYHVCQLTL